MSIRLIYPTFGAVEKVLLGSVLIAVIYPNYTTYDFQTANITTLIGAYQTGLLVGILTAGFVAYLIGSIAINLIERLSDKAEIYKKEIRILSLSLVVVGLLAYLIFFQIGGNSILQQALVFFVTSGISVATIIFSRKRENR